MVRRFQSCLTPPPPPTHTQPLWQPPPPHTQRHSYMLLSELVPEVLGAPKTTFPHHLWTSGVDNIEWIPH